MENQIKTTINTLECKVAEFYFKNNSLNEEITFRNKNGIYILKYHKFHIYNHGRSIGYFIIKNDGSLYVGCQKIKLEYVDLILNSLLNDLPLYEMQEKLTYIGNNKIFNHVIVEETSKYFITSDGKAILKENLIKKNVKTKYPLQRTLYGYSYNGYEMSYDKEELIDIFSYLSEIKQFLNSIQ